MYIPHSVYLDLDAFGAVIIPFLELIPAKPYAGWEKNYIAVHTKRKALEMPYIQPNHPAVIHYLVFDIDDANALYAHHDNHAPPPQIIVSNPENGHAHLLYRLAEPVAMWGDAHHKPIAYMNAVYDALARKLGADLGYTRLICKNPSSPKWNTHAPNDAPECYTLGELADWLELDDWNTTMRKMKKADIANDEFYGRNVGLFHGIRHRCYALAEQYSGNALLSEIIALADDYNAMFDEPLPSNHVVNTARSIYRYCSSPRYKALKAQSDARFSERQARRGAKGGAKSKRGASANSERTQKPWEKLGISRATYYRQKSKNTAEK